jgi:hypothetical protein
MKERKEKKRKKYERTVQSLNRNPCLPGMLSCYIVPFMLLIHSILFVLSKKKKGEQTIAEGTAAVFIPCSLSILTYLVYVGKKESRKRRIVLWHRPSQGHTPQPRQASGSIPSSLSMHTLCVGLSIPQLRCLLAQGQAKMK